MSRPARLVGAFLGRHGPAGGATPPTRTLAYGPVAIALRVEDAGAAAWLWEILQPAFTPTRRAADWHLGASNSRPTYAAVQAQRPPDAAPRICFALDQEVYALPAWPSSGAVTLADTERSCFLRVSPAQVDLVGDSQTRRWRFTLMWACQEIGATRLRRTHLDLHAASVEASGRAVLLVGPKGAGKTTLSLHLLRSGGWRMMANDRAFAGHEGAALVGRGMPTAVKVRPPTLAEFPELRRGLPAVDRPYLHALDELASARPGDVASEAVEFALSPAQLARQLGVARAGAAPLGAIVFPEVEAGASGWAADRLPPAETRRRLLANLYGGSPDRRGATIFEDLDGGQAVPRPELADEIAHATPGFRLVMGPRAYAQPGFSERLRDVLLPP